MPPLLPRRHLLLAGAALALARPLRAAGVLRADWPRRKPAPAVRLPLLDGSTWSLAEQRGHPVLLNFWATWCEPCREEMPALAALVDRERGRGLRVVAVDYRENADAVHRFVDGAALPLPIALDADGAAARSFDVHAFPSTVAIDAGGRARFVVMGQCDWTDARSRGWLDELGRP